MAITVTERPDSRELSEGAADTQKWVYQASGSASHTDVLAAVRAASASTVTSSTGKTLTRLTISADPQFVDASDADRCLWLADVNYGVPTGRDLPAPDGDVTSNSFEIGGGSLHITQAVKHILSYVPGDAVNNDADGGLKGAINVTGGDGDQVVEGVDLPQLGGAQIIELSRWLAPATFTGVYRRTVSRLTMQVNSLAFTIVGVEEYAAGELLFLGMSALARSDAELIEVRYRFAMRENLADAAADWADAQRPLAKAAVPKKGWEYLWVQHKPDVEESVGLGFLSTIQIQRVSVEQVHRTAAFAGLNP